MAAKLIYKQIFISPYSSFKAPIYHTRRREQIDRCTFVAQGNIIQWTKFNDEA